MADRDETGARWTVGSLSGQPLGESPRPEAPLPPAPPPQLQESPSWVVVDGQVGSAPLSAHFGPSGHEELTYNNPFAQNLERVWFDGRLVFAVDAGEVEVDPGKVKVAQEYAIVHDVELDEAGKLRRMDPVIGQYNIYDSVPGMPQYSPIWQFNYVVVPEGYEPNSLRSASACEQSGFRIARSNQFEN